MGLRQERLVNEDGVATLPDEESLEPLAGRDWALPSIQQLAATQAWVLTEQIPGAEGPHRAQV